MTNRLFETAFSMQKLIDDAPGFLGMLSLDSKLLIANQTGCKWVGLSTQADNIFNISYTDLPCQAAEDADLFIQQDQLIQRNKKPIYFVGAYSYANKNWKIIFGKKYLFLDQIKKPLAIISQFDEVTNYRLIDICRFLNQEDKKYYSHDNLKFCYLLDDYSFDHEKLSTRELECLFFY